MTSIVKTITCSRCPLDSHTEWIDKVDHKFSSYVYNDDAKIGVDGTETASCDYGCGTTDTRTKKGSALVQKNPFTDVKDGSWYFNAVLWAIKNKITSGISATTFAPDDVCTRGQIVTFLYRQYK